MANQTLQKLIEEFKTGKITKTIRSVPFIRDPHDDRPCWNWTLKNRILMVVQGTFDARNISQWNSLNRKIVANSKAIYIIKPRVVYTCVKCSKDKKYSVWMTYQRGKGVFECAECGLACEYAKIGEAPASKIGRRIRGYGCQPEFRVEDTVGQSLPEYKPAMIPPLADVAAKWGVNIKYQMDPTRRTMGSFSPDTNSIYLGTENAGIFFHEISHVADNILLKKSGKKLKGGQDSVQEAVAQLSACVLCEMYGIKPPREFTFEYLRQYVKHGSDDEIIQLALRVLDRTGAVIDLILSTSNDLRRDKQTSQQNSTPSTPRRPTRRQDTGS